MRAKDLTSQVGHPFTQNFAARDYGARSQNWAAAQDAQGILYFGNQGVVLQYDGVSWQKIPINQATDVVRGVAADPATGTVFVGTLNELGYLAADATGQARYHSLLDFLPREFRQFRAVQRIYPVPGGVFFTAEAQVMLWREGRFRTWNFPAARLLKSFWVNGGFYVQDPAIGLLRLEGDTFVPASEDPIFRRAVLMALVPNADGTLTAGTLRDGLFTLRPDGGLTPFPGELNGFFKASEIRRGLRLRDGTLALATATSGVIVLDAAGAFRDRWDQAAGVQNDSPIDFFEDREGGVWLCLASGITRVEARSPLTIFDRENGLKSALAHSMGRWDGTFYVASGAGVFRLVPTMPDRARPARAEPVPGLEGDCWSLCAFDDRLLVADTFGVLQLDRAGTVSRVLNAGFSGGVLARSQQNPARVFVGRRNELRSLRYDAGGQRWLDEGIVPGVGGETHTIAQTPDGDLWLGTNDRGVRRVHFDASPDGVSLGTATVLPAAGPGELLSDQTWTRTAELPGGGVLTATKIGLFQLDAAHAHFVTATSYGRDLSGNAYRFDDIEPDGSGNLWFNARPADGIWPEQEVGWVGKDSRTARPTLERTLSHQIINQISVIDCIHAEPDALWMAGPGGLVRLDFQAWRRTGPAPDFATLIRRADTAPDSGPPTITPLVQGDRLPYSRNSVRFHLAANTFRPDLGLRYRTRLLGFGAGAWSTPDEHTDIHFTNLPEGRYVFEAVAHDANDHPGTQAQLPFTVLPPPYRTGWAYTGYGLAGIALVFGVVRWRLRGLRRANAHLEKVVSARTSDLRANERELVHARDAAEAANRAKSAFLANMSHELRTPLNAVLGYTQILLKEPDLPPRHRERLVVVGQSGSHLLSMINEVLDLSKIEAGRLTVMPMDFRLAEVLDEVAAAFRPRLLEKGLEFRTDRAVNLPEAVRSDAGKLRQVLFNLLGNAVKFTRFGTVTLKTTCGGENTVRFTVEDTGVGIAPGEVGNIFVAFHQSGDHTSAAQGTGLGLTISQRLVSLLGGQLQVESAFGQGSRFWFELDLPPVDPSPTLLAQGLADGHRVVGYEGPRRSLLVVDDEPVNRDVLRGLLEPLGFALEEAADGAECLERCAGKLPDALLLDLRMDGVSGFEVARRLRARADGAALKIIAVSASVFDDHRQKAIDAGCDDFLPKPFREESLLGTLQRALGLKWRTASADDAAVPEDEDADVAPPTAEVDAMLELSRRGDILGIKKRLQALRSQPGGYGGCHALARGLEPLVASYQMDRIRDTLIRFKQNGTA